MDTIITILLGILIFGSLIFIHEFGHYLFARIFHVTIKEFSIGMGPKIFHWDSKKTNIRYAIGVFPFGGYVSMEGEDTKDGEVSTDPNSFDKKPAWQRLIITLAGITFNLVIGFLCMILLAALVDLGGTKIGFFYKDSENEEVRNYYKVSSADSGLQKGDTIVAVGDRRVIIYEELAYEIMRKGNEPVDITVLRGGEEIRIRDVAFPTQEESGQTFGMMDFVPCYFANPDEKDFGDVLVYSWHRSTLIVRMCWESIYDLITGRYSLAAVSGPVGITEVIGEARTADGGGAESVFYIFILISINLGVMNLLPIPALDGGRALLYLVEILTKKKLPTKIESVINSVFLILLLIFSFFVMVKDIIQLFV